MLSLQALLVLFLACGARADAPVPVCVSPTIGDDTAAATMGLTDARGGLALVFATIKAAREWMRARNVRNGVLVLSGETHTLSGELDEAVRFQASTGTWSLDSLIVISYQSYLERTSSSYLGTAPQNMLNSSTTGFCPLFNSANYSSARAKVSCLSAFSDSALVIEPYRDSGWDGVDMANCVCTDTQNEGAAIEFDHGSGKVDVRNAHFENCTSAGDGGAVSIENGGGSTALFFYIANVVFENNFAREGGSLIINGCGGKIISSVFRNNFASGDGGALLVETCFETAQADIQMTPSLISLEECLFEGNEAADDGGHIRQRDHCADGTFELGPLAIDNCQFRRGRSTSGGALRANGPVVLRNCDFDSNDAMFNITAVEAGAGGGAIHFEYNAGDSRRSTGITLCGCNISQNSAWRSGGGLRISSRRSDEYAHYPIRIIDSVFYENVVQSKSGGAMEIEGASDVLNKRTLFENNFAQERGGGLRARETAHIFFQDCAFRNNSANDRGGAVDCNIDSVSSNITFTFNFTSILSSGLLDNDLSCVDCGGAWRFADQSSMCPACLNRDICGVCGGGNSSCTPQDYGQYRKTCSEPVPWLDFTPPIPANPSSSPSSVVLSSANTGPVMPVSSSFPSSPSVLPVFAVALAVAATIACLMIVAAAILIYRRRTRVVERLSQDSEPVEMEKQYPSTRSESMPAGSSPYITTPASADVISVSMPAADRSHRSTFEYLDDVVVGKLLGSGNFGQVFEGTWVSNKVALKLVSAVSADLPKEGYERALREFENEVEVLAGFRHPNIVQLFGLAHVGESEQAPYMVMEFCEQGSVLDLLTRRRIDGKFVPLAEKLNMAVDAAKGVEYLHKQRTQHRDLACRNLLVDGSGAVKIADFGLARQVDDVYTASSKAAVPVRWASPEQLGQGKTSFASDVYSFGVTIYEILSDGAQPFTGMSNAEVTREVLAGKAAAHLLCPSCVSDGDGLALSFDLVIVPCWNMKTSERPTMGQLRANLEKASAAVARTVANESVPAHVGHDIMAAHYTTTDAVLREAESRANYQ